MACSLTSDTNMVEVVFGWPAAFASVCVTTVGIAFRVSVLTLTGAVIALPFMFYLCGTPIFGRIAPIVVASHFGATLALRRSGRLLAAVLFAPYVASVTYAVWLVAGSMDR